MAGVKAVSAADNRIRSSDQAHVETGRAPDASFARCGDPKDGRISGLCGSSVNSFHPIIGACEKRAPVEVCLAGVLTDEVRRQ